MIAELHSGLLQRLNRPFDVAYAHDDAVPAAGVLAPAVGHGPRAGRSRTTEQQLEITPGDGGERLKLLVLQLEAEVPGVEIDGLLHVVNLIANAMVPENQGFVASRLIGGHSRLLEKIGVCCQLVH